MKKPSEGWVKVNCDASLNMSLCRVEDWVKVNCDASLNKYPCRVGLGIVIRDHDGRVLSAKCISKEGAVDPGAAEAMSLSGGVFLCISLGFHFPECFCGRRY